MKVKDASNVDALLVEKGLNPLRVTIDDVCHILRITRDHLHKLTQKNPSFPKKYKAGTSRQASVYFDYEEIKKWHEAQKKAITE